MVYDLNKRVLSRETVVLSFKNVKEIEDLELATQKEQLRVNEGTSPEGLRIEESSLNDAL